MLEISEKYLEQLHKELQEACTKVIKLMDKNWELVKENSRLKNQFTSAECKRLAAEERARTLEADRTRILKEKDAKSN